MTERNSASTATTKVAPQQIARGASALPAPLKSSMTADRPASFCICSVMYSAACCSSSVPAGRGPICCDKYATWSRISGIPFAFRSRTCDILLGIYAVSIRYLLVVPK